MLAVRLPRSKLLPPVHCMLLLSTLLPPTLPVHRLVELDWLHGRPCCRPCKDSTLGDGIRLVLIGLADRCRADDSLSGQSGRDT